MVEVMPDLMTGYPGIFAGCDMVPSERTATVAIGDGKKAARASTPSCAAPAPGRLGTRPPRSVP